MPARRIYMILIVLFLVGIGVILTFDSGYRVGKDIANRENNSRSSTIRGENKS